MASRRIMVATSVRLIDLPRTAESSAARASETGRRLCQASTQHQGYRVQIEWNDAGVQMDVRSWRR